MSTFLSKIQEMQNQLKQMGEEVSDKFVITKVLMSLADEYKHFVSAWESAPDDKQTMDNLVARLLVEEERVKEKGEAPTPSSSAFIAKNKNNAKCMKCNRLGHYASECRSNNSNNKSEGHNNKCFYCGKGGHNKAQCWFRKNKEQKKSNAFVVSDSLEPHNKTLFLVDSGSSEHICRERALFSTFTSANSEWKVEVGNGVGLSVLGHAH
ncbi:uncharacterized protein LOC134655497 [Cydia amplana]|uniref:uncharacterized protein LOC134655497 n=1 Tax=Cydia amplana TaxID=1869771 RepID=UPI002FE59DC5